MILFPIPSLVKTVRKGGDAARSHANCTNDSICNCRKKDRKVVQSSGKGGMGSRPMWHKQVSPF